MAALAGLVLCFLLLGVALQFCWRERSSTKKKVLNDIETRVHKHYARTRRSRKRTLLKMWQKPLLCSWTSASLRLGGNLVLILIPIPYNQVQDLLWQLGQVWPSGFWSSMFIILLCSVLIVKWHWKSKTFWKLSFIKAWYVRKYPLHPKQRWHFPMADYISLRRHVVTHLLGKGWWLGCHAFIFSRSWGG